MGTTTKIRDNDIKKIIELYNNHHSTYEIACMYNTYPGRIRRCLLRNNIKIRTSRESLTTYNHQTVIDVIDKYNKVKNISNVAYLLNLSHKVVNSILKKNNIETPNPQQTKYNWEFIQDQNNLFFYWLGWALSDGSISERKRGGINFVLHIHQQDKHVLEFFNSQINPKINISEYKKSNSCRITYSVPRRLFLKLKEWGLIPNKTYLFKLTRLLKSISNDGFFQLLVGIIEGDGCIYTYKNQITLSISGNKNLLEWISLRLSKCGLQKKKVYKKKSEFDHELRYRKRDTLKVIQLLMGTKYHLLSRKWNKISLI